MVMTIRLLWPDWQGDLVERGQRITFRAEHRDAFMRKCSLTPSSKSLLLLCGDMRCFR